jgi:simple sugar transport system substrate-binding protein
MVDIDAVDAALASDVRAGLQARRAAIVAGTLAPFAAPLVDNAGTTRLARGALADADIQSMDWFAAGVVGNVAKAR